MTDSSIWHRRLTLEKERREAVRTAMADYDKTHYAKMAELRKECGAAGHAMRFTHVGPLGHPWFTCGQCGLSKMEES